MTFPSCGSATVAAGQNTVVEPAIDPTGWDLQSVLIHAPGRTNAAAPGRGATAAANDLAVPAKVVTWTDSSRVLRVSASQAAYLEVPQNYNAGWQAAFDGKTLRPVRLDGWEQAWLLPAGSRGQVTLTYRPDTLYRAALFGGLALLAAIIAIALLPRRRRPRALHAARPAQGTGAARTRDTARARPAKWRRNGGVTAVAIRLAGIAALAAAGLWLGGYPGAVLIPAAAVVFALAGRATRGGMPGAPRFVRAVGLALYSRWGPAGLVLAAAAAGAAGGLTLDGSALATALTNTGPQVLGLVVVARLAAALVAGPEGGIPDNDLPDKPENI